MEFYKMTLCLFNLMVAKLIVFTPLVALDKVSLCPLTFSSCTLDYLCVRSNEALHNKSWKPIKIANRGPYLSHSFFALRMTLCSLARLLRITAMLFRKFSRISATNLGND